MVKSNENQRLIKLPVITKLGIVPKRLKRNIVTGLMILCFFLFASNFFPAGNFKAQSFAADSLGEMAILPFNINSIQPLDHLKKGLQEILGTRISQKGFSLISPNKVNKHSQAFQRSFETSDLIAIGKDLKSDWVVTGSLTQIGTRISIDIKVIDVKGKRAPVSLFMVSDDIDNLSETTERIATGIYDQIKGVVQIEAIYVEGNKRIETEAVLAVLESRKGEGFDQAKLDKDLRVVYRMGFFNDVQIRTEDGAKGKIVIFVVDEKPSITNIAFHGNDKIKDEDLDTEAGIKKYSILNRNNIKQSINRLKELYRSKNFYSVKIEEKIEERPNNEVSLIYNIEEGKKLYITKIEFIGNTRFDDDDLKDLMETSEKGFLSWFTSSGTLHNQLLEFDIYKVTSFYHNNGFIKAKAGEPQIDYNQEKGLIITIEVIEGEQYKVNNINIEGDLIKPAKELLPLTRIKKGTFYSRETVQQDTMTFRNMYANVGYANVTVSPLIKEDDEKHLVDIIYKISKGKKIRFERINITGNTRTRDKVIRRELDIIESDYFSGEGLQKSNANLTRLGYFENIEIKPRDGSREDLMILDVDVQERPTGNFTIGAGYSSYESAIGSFSIAENNLFGHGQRLQLAASIGGRTTDFSLIFTEPWLLDKPVSATTKLYKIETEHYDYTRDSLGVGFSIGFPIKYDEYTRGSIGYTYDNSDVFDVDDNAALAIKEMVGTNTTSSLLFRIRRDSRDEPWSTTKGSVNSLSFEYAGSLLAGDVGYNRYSATSEWYFPFPWETVYLMKFNIGYMQRHSGEKLPIYQKYSLGGLSSIRGFDYGTISPKDPATGDYIGGEKMFYYNIEYRFPLVKEQGVVGIVFFDAGNVFSDDENYSFDGIKKSAGVGIRWYSPVGPLRFEYGYNLDPVGNESSGQYEFGMGGVF